MKPTDLAQSYDQITHLWTSDSFNRENGISQHKRALQFLPHEGTALDIGCGCTGRFLELLQAQGFEVEGLDLSPKMLELARERHPGITFHHADITKVSLPEQYNFITAWDSIWHIPLDCHEETLRKILRTLKPNGVLIFTAGGFDEPGEKYDNAMGPEVYYSVLSIQQYLAIFAEEDCVCRHMEFDQWPEKHLYFIVQKL